jgi:hypothetical protein
MGRKMEDGRLFFVLAGVARERRSEIGDGADLARDPVWQAALAFTGLALWAGVEDAELRARKARNVFENLKETINDEA